jgi:dynein heavy chain
MWSSDGEMVTLKEKLYPKGNVEDWLLELERVMRESLRKTLEEALKVYPQVII